jgi:pyrroline-5-carboxylate reductase
MRFFFLSGGTCPRYIKQAMFRFASLTTRQLMPATERILHIHNMVSAQKSHPTVAFIGGGNMAEAIIGGLVASGHPCSNISFSDLAQERRDYMNSKYPSITSSPDNLEVIADAEVVILAVKPQVLHNVVNGISQTLQARKPLIISIVAGIAAADINRWIGGSESAIVRCMPNTPALVGEGAAGLYATEVVTNAQKNLAEKIANAVSKETIWVATENQIDSVTAISGSGPAYFFLIMEAMGESYFSKLMDHARTNGDRFPKERLKLESGTISL